MPRKRKVAVTQPIQAPSGLPYGQRAQLEDAQRQVPLPNQAPPPPAANPDPFAAALSAAERHPMPGGGLDGPTMRPSEPVTAGSPLGLGPGPEALGVSPSIASSFRQLGAELDDPTLAGFASLVEQLGL